MKWPGRLRGGSKPGSGEPAAERAADRAAKRRASSGASPSPSAPGDDQERVRRLASDRRARDARTRSELAAKAKGRREESPPRSRAARFGGELAAALRHGSEETRLRARRAAPGLAERTLALLAAAYSIFFAVVAAVLNFAIAVARFVAGPLRAALGRGRGVLEAASRALTPARVLGVVVAGAIALLALSQFADYRSLSIGNDNYAGGVQTVAPAPEVDRDATGSAHSYALIPVAAVCLLLLALALRGRWQLCRLIALGGVAAVVVGLVVDRPAGLDLGKQALAYEGIGATLLGGFYAELFAGLLLALSALMLGRELRLAGAAEPERATHPATTSRSLGRSAPAEGARA